MVAVVARPGHGGPVRQARRPPVLFVRPAPRAPVQVTVRRDLRGTFKELGPVGVEKRRAGPECGQDIWRAS